jgi:hypothetical protein
MHDPGAPGCGLVGRTVGTKARAAPGEFTYHPSADPTASAADPPNFVLVEVLLPKPKPAAEKETFWAKFRAGFEARLGSMKTDIALHFVEMPRENLYFNRKAPPF